MIGLGTYQSVILKLRIQKVLTTVYILHKVLSTHGISSWGIKEFDDKEFLTKKTDKENEEFTSLKWRFFWLKLAL